MNFRILGQGCIDPQECCVLFDKYLLYFALISEAVFFLLDATCSEEAWPLFSRQIELSESLTWSQSAVRVFILPFTALLSAHCSAGLKTLPVQSHQFSSVKVAFYIPWTEQSSSVSVELQDRPAKWRMSRETAHHHSCTPVLLPSLTHWRGREEEKITTKKNSTTFVWKKSSPTRGGRSRDRTRAKRFGNAMHETNFFFYSPILAKGATDEAWLLRAPDKHRLVRGSDSPWPWEWTAIRNNSWKRGRHFDRARTAPAWCTFALDG